MARLWRDDIDFAYFAAHLGWDIEQYESCTPVQLLFIRKEIESKTVRDSSLTKDAVQVAISNSMSRRKTRLWSKRAGAYDESAIPLSEIDAIQEQMKRRVPWTPWQGGGVQHG